jgi:hypothetical protein
MKDPGLATSRQAHSLDWLLMLPPKPVFIPDGLPKGL